MLHLKYNYPVLKSSCKIRDLFAFCIDGVLILPSAANGSEWVCIASSSRLILCGSEEHLTLATAHLVPF